MAFSRITAVAIVASCILHTCRGFILTSAAHKNKNWKMFPKSPAPSIASYHISGLGHYSSCRSMIVTTKLAEEGTDASFMEWHPLPIDPLRQEQEQTKMHLDFTRKMLEVNWIRSRRQSQPRFYTYETCKAMVSSWQMTSAVEWKNWIDMGEKRNCLIPSDPETVYGRQGMWVSWDDFLGNM